MKSRDIAGVGILTFVGFVIWLAVTHDAGWLLLALFLLFVE